MKIILTSSFIVFSLLYVSAQESINFDNYSPLLSVGKIPNELQTTSTSKFQKDLEKLENEKSNHKTKKAKKSFSLESNFILDKLLRSGYILFNDNISNYLQKIVNKLNEKNKSTVKVYTLRTSAVNAFATARGDIFVTVGLLAQVENEAQLAFILAHELTHIKEKHTLELYLDTEGLGKKSNDKDISKKTTIDTKILKKCHYSKEMEKKADDGGLQILKNSEYSTSNLSDVFDVLKYSYLPYDEVKFDPTFLESKNYKLPKELILGTVNKITTEDQEENPRSSHPSIKSRRSSMIEQLKKTDSKGKQEYLFTKDEFLKIRNIARFELPYYYLRDEDYSNAIYSSYLILQQFPKNKYANSVIAKALYYYSKYRNQEDFNNEKIKKAEEKYLDNFTYNKRTQKDEKAALEKAKKEKELEKEKFEKENEPEGESHAVYNLLLKMDSKEITLLAAHWIWKCYLDDKMEELQPYAEDILVEVNNNKLQLKDFNTSSNVVESTVQNSSSNPSDNSEKSKKRMKIEQNQSSKNINYWVYSFENCINNQTFIDTYKSAQKTSAKRKETQEYYESTKGIKEYQKEKKKNEKYGLSMGIKKIVIVNPYYLKLNAKKENSLEYVKTEKGQIHFNQLIKEISKKFKFRTELLDVADLKETEINKFNDIKYLNEYFTEQVNREGLTISPSIEQSKINDIARKYDTNYFLWTGTISLLTKENYGANFLELIFLPYLAPFIIYDVVTPNNNMLHYAILFDITTGKRQLIKAGYYPLKDSDSVVKSHIYDTLNQISSK